MAHRTPTPFRRLTPLTLAATCLLTSCDGPSAEAPPGPCDAIYSLLRHLRVDQVSHPSPVVPGSTLEILGEGFSQDRGCVIPQVTLLTSTGPEAEVAPLEAEVLSTNHLTARFTREAVDLLGAGRFEGILSVVFRSADGAPVFRTSSTTSFELAATITPALAEVPGGDVSLNDRLLLRGSGFLVGEAEGQTEVVLTGTFTPDDGTAPRDVLELRLSTEPLDPTDRSLTSFAWSPRVGGLGPGRFEGTIAAENVHLGGEHSAGSSRPLVVAQQETFVFDFDPSVFSLGQLVDIRGRGFIGPPDGTTSLHLEGEFRPDQGALEAATFALVGDWESGELIRYTVTVDNEGEYLHAVDFGVHRGEFTGRLTPVLTTEHERHEGQPTTVTLTLGPVRQIAWVRFLPGFDDSLELFGLGGVSAEIERQVLEQLQHIYCPPEAPEECLNVEFRNERPEDFSENGYAVVDIGGPDPNGFGLFGFDNTAGKDVGNLRLHDHVGGENALGAIDGFAYGGIFIESVLFWSTHPPASLGPPPPAAPSPNALFDEVFDPVREQEVVADEYPSGASPARLAEIDAAISALSNVIADTAAHEFAHSLGLAQPYGDPTGYHNPVPRAGCLMDAGPDRSFEERARLNGNPGARFCDDNLLYLLDLLPTE